MSFKDTMNKIRYWDNLTAKWLMRHFYFMFFQIVLFIIFLFWFVNLFKVIDTHVAVPAENLTERILLTQSTNSTIIVFLLLLNSFWMLYIFNTLQRTNTLLKEMNYNLLRFRTRYKNKNS